MTIGTRTRKYNEIPLKTPATIETIAICHSLKYIANVLGYRIMDLNYPVLATLIQTINRHNADINVLQHYVSSITNQTRQIQHDFHQINQRFRSCDYFHVNQPQIQKTMDQLLEFINTFHMIIAQLNRDFSTAKVHPSD